MVERLVPIAPSSLPTPRPEPLGENHRELYDAVEAHFVDPAFKLSPNPPSELSKEEKFWLTKECILRYLRATKWNQAKAIQRLEATLKWRREYGLTSFITPEYVEPEAVTGKLIVYGFDSDRRPALYMLPSRQNTDDPVRQLQFTVWNLERCIDLMGPGVEGLDLLIDFSDRGKNPSLGTARKMLNILQDHYPERLGRGLVINIPFLVNAFFNLIMPFVDPVTRVKVRFNPQVVTEGLFTSDMITKSWGGEVEFIYKHEEYWPTLVGITNDLREQQMARWEKLGGRIGLSEWDIKGTFEDAVENGNGQATDIPTPTEVGGEPEAEV